MSGAAIATKKPNTSEQLTFPAVFQEVYDLPLQYAPSGMGPRMTPYAGEDFQSDYHQQKKRDADYMARAKVMATTNARHKYVVSPHGYFGLPPVELSQRRFANPSQGALSIYSSRQDGSVSAPFEMAGGLSGGVLRTAEGQGYAKARLQARIRQLDAIAAAKQDFETGTTLKPSAGPAAATSTEVAATTKTELQLILQSIIDALYGATEGNVEDAGVDEGETEQIAGKDAYESVSRIVFNDAVRALSIIIRTASAPEATAEDLEDIIAPVVQIEQLLLALTDPDFLDQQGASEQVQEGLEQARAARTELAKQRVITTQQLFQRIHQYLDRMMEGINRSPNERVALSKALVRTLGFAKFSRDLADARTSEQGALERTARSRLFNAQGRQAFDDEDDDDDEDQFNRPAERREDTEQRGNVATFDPNERDRFGDNSGEFLAYPTEGRPQRARFIEDAGTLGPTAEAAVEEEFKEDETGRRVFGRPATTGLTAEEVSRIRGEPFRRSKSMETERTAQTRRSRRSAMASPQLAPIVEAVRDRASVRTRSTRTAPSTSTRSTRRSRRQAPPRPPRINIPPPTPLALPPPARLPRGLIIPPQFRQQTAPPPQTAPSVSSRSTRSTRSTRAPPRPSAAAMASAAAAPRDERRTEIDNLRTLTDAQAFVERINRMTPIPTTDGKPIKIYADSKIANVRRNFRRRFGV